MTGKKTALIILDGWGHGDKTKSDAIYHANTPFVDSLTTNILIVNSKLMGNLSVFLQDKWGIRK